MTPQRSGVRGIALVAAFAALACGPGPWPEDCAPSHYEGGAFYSQLYEDYVLSMVFAGVDKGVYVDVGANDPSHFSVTKWFYERGWSGVNIDANPQFAPLYAKQRPRDINLFVGVDEKAGSLTFYKISDAPGVRSFRVAGLSTFDSSIAAEHRSHGFLVREIEVPLQRLDHLLAEHGVTRIDFLNVDVEGFERNVLASIDFEATRPAVVMVESTHPLTLIPVQDRWEGILTGNGYVHALFDGLNRYYRDEARDDLVPGFEHAERCMNASKARGGG